MRKRTASKLLSLVLSVCMLFSLLPASVFAEDTASATWTKTTLDAVTAEDTVAITMTASSGKTYILPTAAATNTGPAAVEVTAEGDALAFGTAAEYGWTIAPAADGTWSITGPNGGLNVINSNNGVRVTGASATWTFDQDHLKTTDPAGNDRYLGATTAGQNGPDWRCYKTVSNNITGTTEFWKLTSGSDTPVDPTPDDPTPD